MFDECCKFMFLLRHVSSVYSYHVLREFLCLFKLDIILFYTLLYCEHVRLTRVLIK